ncbi:hypothetical protein JXA47_09690 [Candidatus Sumerlaeota bacterium]|nr:hypothetical protein [Candidatus Sumerlaeota bacterium]
MADPPKTRAGDMDLLDLPPFPAIRAWLREHPRLGSVALSLLAMVLMIPVLYFAFFLVCMGRFLLAPILIGSCDLLVRSLLWQRGKVPVIIGVLGLALCIALLPVMIVFVHADSFEIQLKPILWGLPTEQGMALVESGEMIGGGCVRSLQDWILFVGVPWGHGPTADEIAFVWDIFWSGCSWI